MINSISSINGARIAPFTAIAESMELCNVPRVQSVRGDTDNTGNSRPPERNNLSELEGQVAGQQKRQLSRDGERMLAFRLLAGNLDTMPDLPADVENSHSGMQAVMVSADEENPTDINVKILRVDATGNAEEVYSTGSLEELFPSGRSLELNLVGGRLDAYS
ncbi:MAG: hypothetical protein ACLFN5_01460 [bacterium]